MNYAWLDIKIQPCKYCHAKKHIMCLFLKREKEKMQIKLRVKSERRPAFSSILLMVSMLQYIILKS